jgi:hypothetical protein
MDRGQQHRAGPYLPECACDSVFKHPDKRVPAASSWVSMEKSTHRQNGIQRPTPIWPESGSGNRGMRRCLTRGLPEYRWSKLRGSPGCTDRARMISSKSLFTWRTTWLKGMAGWWGSPGICGGWMESRMSAFEWWSLHQIDRGTSIRDQRRLKGGE